MPARGDLVGEFAAIGAAAEHDVGEQQVDLHAVGEDRQRASASVASSTA